MKLCKWILINFLHNFSYFINVKFNIRLSIYQMVLFSIFFSVYLVSESFIHTFGVTDANLCDGSV